MPLPLFRDSHIQTRSTLHSHSLSKVGAVIAIAAGKGGVGKSTVAVNLALALSELGFRVGIMDTDIYGPSIRKMLPEERLPAQKGKFILPAVCQGISVISMAYFRKDDEAVAVRGPIANHLIAQFINKVEWGALDFLLIDFPPGTGDVQLTICQQARLMGAVMVTTPQEIALMDVQKAISLFQQVNVPVLGIIENMSFFRSSSTQEPIYPFGKGGGQHLATKFAIPLLGKIPLDPQICISGDKGESIFVTDSQENDSAIVAFRKIAGQIVQNIERLKREKEGGTRDFELIWQEKIHS